MSGLEQRRRNRDRAHQVVLSVDVVDCVSDATPPSGGSASGAKGPSANCGDAPIGSVASRESGALIRVHPVRRNSAGPSAAVAAEASTRKPLSEISETSEIHFAPHPAREPAEIAEIARIGKSVEKSASDDAPRLPSPIAQIAEIGATGRSVNRAH